MGDSLWRYYFGVLTLVIACKVNLSRALILDSIYWNTTNTKFVPGQGLVLYPQIGDKMDIVCPRVEGGSMEGVEYYKLYMVPREQLDSCTVTKADTPLLNCVKPDQDVKFTLKFQEFSPNLWGLEFFRGKDYYIISTSNGTMEGLENQEGGVCKTKSMKILMKVGQDPSDPIFPKDYPTRYPPRHPETDRKDTKSNEVIDKHDASHHEEKEEGNKSSVIGSEIALFAGIASASVIVIIIIIMLVFLLLKYRRRHRKHSPQHATTLSLSTLATPKRGGSNNNGSEPSDIIIPLRTADSVFCPHYEKVSGDYGHPVYIVQEMPPQSPANIYYKV
ncbi:Ephrin-B2a Precursor [Triplophysa tibetana]|uniref:Ephrin-B2a n=1 Tax=Triplophysa tibetana TaxID=1572043 RepID=A0A5A9P1J7_9TELE|nr:Ephrin-B2a Precursor [Triplophysa tibetana]